MELSGQARGKLLLFGEHAVVYGHPALGLSLPLTTRMVLTERAGAGDSENTRLLTRLVQHWDPRHRENWHRSSWDIRIQSTVPMNCGFGSSAALTGALARAWSQTLSPAPDDHGLWQLAHQAEREFHGRPSGVDTALALGNGLIAFTRCPDDPDDRPHMRTVPSSPFALVTGSLPRNTDAKTLIAGIHGQRNQRPGVTQRRLSRLGDLASEAIAQMENAGPDRAAHLGRLARDAQEILHDLGLSTPPLDEILKIGMDAGACGGKLSGAGGGGAFVLFCRTPEDACRVCHAIVQQGPDVSANMQAYHWNGETLQAL